MNPEQDVTIRERDVFKNVMVRITVKHRIHDRLAYWLGLKLIEFGAWLIGCSGVDVDDPVSMHLEIGPTELK